MQNLGAELVFEYGKLVVWIRLNDGLKRLKILMKLFEVEQLSLADLLLKDALNCLISGPRLCRILVIMSLVIKLAVQGLVKIGCSLTFQLVVPVVLDCVVTSAQDELCDMAPASSKYLRHQKQDPLFIFLPWSTSRHQQRIKLVEPSFSALLSLTVFKSLCQRIPHSGSVFHDLLEQNIVLFLCPSSL